MKARKKFVSGIFQLGKRTHIVCLAIALFCTCIALFAEFRTSAKEIPSIVYYDLVLPKNQESVIQNIDVTTSECRYRDRKVTPTGEKPKVKFTFSDGRKEKFHSVIVYLKEGLWRDTECKLYYQTEDGSYKKKYKSSCLLPKGQTIICFTIPDKVDYETDGFRIDINETYEIKDLCISLQMPTQLHVLRISYWGIPVYFICLFILTEIVCVFIKRYQKNIKDYFQLKKRNILRSAFYIAVFGFCMAIIGSLVSKSFEQNTRSYWIYLFCIFGLLVGYELSLLFRGAVVPNHVYDNKEGSSINSSRKKVVYWLYVCIVVLFFLFYLFDGERNSERLPGVLSRRVFYVFVISELIILAALYQKYIAGANVLKTSREKIYLYIIFVLGLGYMFVFLPFVVPDEPSHYVSAYRVSNLILGKFSQFGDSALIMRYDDYAFFIHRNLMLSDNYMSNIQRGFSFISGNNGYMAVTAPMVTNAVLCYCFSGLGIAIGRVLHLSSTMTFYLGRFANLAAFLLFMNLCMKKIPERKTALFTIAAMPMMLHSIASYSYDVLTFSFAALYITELMSVAYGKERASRRDFLLMILYACLLGPSKLVYMPLLLLVFLIPSEKLADTKREAYKKKCTVIICGICAAVLIMGFAMLVNRYMSASNLPGNSQYDNILDWIKEPSYSITWIIRNPIKYILIVVRTIIKLTDSFVYSMVGWRLGWWNIQIPYIFPFIFLLVYCFAVNLKDEPSEMKPLSTAKRVWILILCLASAAAIFVAMTIAYTPVSYDYINGVQGRYFLPLLVAAIWLLHTDLIKVKGSACRYIILVDTTFNLWTLVHVFSRYILE